MEKIKKEVKTIKAGDVVKSNAHPHKMCVHSIDSENVVCNYFIEDELHTENHFKSTLITIS